MHDEMMFVGSVRACKGRSSSIVCGLQGPCPSGVRIHEGLYAYQELPRTSYTTHSSKVTCSAAKYGRDWRLTCQLHCMSAVNRRMPLLRMGLSPQIGPLLSITRTYYRSACFLSSSDALYLYISPLTLCLSPPQDDVKGPRPPRSTFFFAT
jgi:hypothetical protein